jgi:hypothetical protein
MANLYFVNSPIGEKIILREKDLNNFEALIPK